MAPMIPKAPSNSTYSQQVIKDRNATLLFNLVRKLAPISRAELAKISGLSPATVTVLMEELLKNQWIRELSAAERGTRGRRPIQLEVNANAGYVVTLEILSESYVCSFYDICQTKIAEHRYPYTAASTADVCSRLENLICRLGKDRLLGIHILYPGLFDRNTGHLGFSAVIPRQNMLQADLIDILRAQFPDVHIMISNNATAMAYSVFASHTPHTPVPLLALSIHEGINAGIVTDDQTCIPLEAGHIIIRQNGDPCTCGNQGCLETLCSTTALFRQICEKTALQPQYQESYGAEVNVKAMEQVAAAFIRGEPDVSVVVEEFACALCSGIVSIVNLFGLQAVYIGGTIRLLGDPFIHLIRKLLAERFRIITNTQIVHCALFDDDLEASRKAAVTLTMERLFQRN